MIATLECIHMEKLNGMEFSLCRNHAAFVWRRKWNGRGMWHSIFCTTLRWKTQMRFLVQTHQNGACVHKVFLGVVMLGKFIKDLYNNEHASFKKYTHHTLFNRLRCDTLPWNMVFVCQPKHFYLMLKKTVSWNHYISYLCYNCLKKESLSWVD